MKLEFEQATGQFQVVYVKDNHQQVDCVWNDTNWLDGSTFVYRVPYQSKKKKIRIGDSDSLYWRHALTITESNAPILKRNTKTEFKTLILKDSEGLSVIFSELTACQMQRKSSPAAFLCFESLDVIYLVWVSELINFRWSVQKSNVYIFLSWHSRCTKSSIISGSICTNYYYFLTIQTKVITSLSFWFVLFL